MAAELRQKLIGAWALVEYKTQPASGAPATYPLGKDAAGIIMYTPDGYMSAQLMQPGAPKFVVGDLSGGTKDELAESMKRYLAYSGRFAVKEEGGKPVLTHQMEVSSFPNWLGNVQQRTVKVEGEYLTLGTEGPILVLVGNSAFFRPIAPDGNERRIFHSSSDHPFMLMLFISYADNLFSCEFRANLHFQHSCGNACPRTKPRDKSALTNTVCWSKTSGMSKTTVFERGILLAW